MADARDSTSNKVLSHERVDSPFGEWVLSAASLPSVKLLSARQPPDCLHLSCIKTDSDIAVTIQCFPVLHIHETRRIGLVLLIRGTYEEGNNDSFFGMG